MAYNGLTNAGAAYKAAREANNLPVEFLKAKVGNGIVPSGTDPAELTDIISGKMEVEITDIHQVERALKMTVQVSNESLATGFYLTEIAIYVNDNGTPVLYWYIGKDNGTYVPDSTKPMKYKNILNIEVSSTPVTTVNYTGKDLWIDEETLNAKFGTGEREILEGIRLAQILGLEFAGELNNSNTKKANKVYYDTQNKSYFKCLNDNVLNYADSNYYEGISNNNLLLKLQNLSKVIRKTNIYVNGYPNLKVRLYEYNTFFYIAFETLMYVPKGVIISLPDWNFPSEYAISTNLTHDWPTNSQEFGSIRYEKIGIRVVNNIPESSVGYILIPKFV